MKIQNEFTLFLAMLVFILCGCQQSPDNTAVVSKNDGSFDISILQSATTPAVKDRTNHDANVTAAEIVERTDVFFSTDSSVEFTIDINSTIENLPMPVVKVAPHYLTEADAKRVAGAIFGEADFYEAEPRFSATYSKEEIRQKLERWAAYAGDNGIIDAYIQKYTLLMETAPIENPHKLCEWKYKKATCYLESPDIVESMDTSQDNDEIRAAVKIGNIPYALAISTRNKSDFKLNNIFVQPYDGLSPQGIDSRIFRTQLCLTSKPDESVVETVKEKALSILKEINLGEWQIDMCYVTSDEANPNQFAIHIKAVPMFEKIAAFRRPQLGNLNSKTTYASNYYLTDAYFQFNINGDLVYFEMYSPVDVIEIVNNNVQVLSIGELINLAKSHFRLSDYREYDYLLIVDSYLEDMGCKVSISKMDYGLTRVKVPDTDEYYYYIPAITFWGSIEYYGKESGNVYDVAQGSGELFQLLTLNAIDGSVINSTNE